MTPQVGDRVVSTYGTGKVVPPIYDLPGAVGVLLDNGMTHTFVDPRVAGVHVIERRRPTPEDLELERNTA